VILAGRACSVRPVFCFPPAHPDAKEASFSRRHQRLIFVLDLC